MFEYLQSLPEWLEAAMWTGVIVSVLARVAGSVYRLARYGIKVEAGPVKIDASEENEPKEVKPDGN